MEQRLKRLLTPPFIVLAALLLWFWEWLWEPLENFMAIIGRWPVLRQVETWITQAPRYIALTCFIIPGAVLLPFKLVGIYFIGHGAAFLGIATFLAAKVVGTALVARIFALTKHQLMEIAWFARAYVATIRFKNIVFDTLHNHPVYQRTRAALLALRRNLRSARRGMLSLVLRRWRAVYRLFRRRGRQACC
ncbi:MAG: hypothetical protein KGP14_01270 [Betaproteobacteria bacterium]|nr:hypothetical protein [Betaproteobacteria bacterium]